MTRIPSTNWAASEPTGRRGRGSAPGLNRSEAKSQAVRSACVPTRKVKPALGSTSQAPPLATAMDLRHSNLRLPSTHRSLGLTEALAQIVQLLGCHPEQVKVYSRRSRPAVPS